MEEKKQLLDDEIKDTNGGVLVYDLGGGTFDVSILSIEDGKFNPEKRELIDMIEADNQQ
ncbi:MAG: Hsp70 family protein [Erysipelotrichaceae bacterium]|nr:Hsp70 family protein [Erysipelotrichaceae bacterium]